MRVAAHVAVHEKEALLIIHALAAAAALHVAALPNLNMAALGDSQEFGNDVVGTPRPSPFYRTLVDYNAAPSRHFTIAGGTLIGNGVLSDNFARPGADMRNWLSIQIPAMRATGKKYGVIELWDGMNEAEEGLKYNWLGSPAGLMQIQNRQQLMHQAVSQVVALQPNAKYVFITNSDPSINCSMNPFQVNRAAFNGIGPYIDLFNTQMRAEAALLGYRAVVLEREYDPQWQRQSTEFGIAVYDPGYSCIHQNNLGADHIAQGIVSLLLLP